MMMRALKEIALTLYHIVIPRDKDVWPDYKCTGVCTGRTKKARKIRSKGKLVAPIEEYVFHSNFDTLTDGSYWIIRTDSRFIDFIVMTWFLGGVGIFMFTVLSFHGASLGQHSYFSFPLLVGVMIFSGMARLEKGSNKWIIFDRESGNVCFWYKNRRKSITVPFEKVKCYWYIKVYRGGVSKNLMLMPDVSLPGEWNRWWNTYFGSTQIYPQAQYLWRVLTDFMDSSRPLPEIPGLTHQVRCCERLGYTIEDLTHGGKEIPLELWAEVDQEIQDEITAICSKTEELLEPEVFDAERVIKHYRTIPPLARRMALIEMKTSIDCWVRWMRDHNGLYPGLSGRFTMEEFVRELDLLVSLVRGGLEGFDRDWPAPYRS